MGRNKRELTWHSPAPAAPNLCRYLEDRGYLSYSAKSGENAISAMAAELGNLLVDAAPGLMPEDFKLENGLEETALTDGEHFWGILNGDFRVEYAKCKTYSEALAVYESLKAKYRSNWSVDE